MSLPENLKGSNEPIRYCVIGVMASRTSLLEVDAMLVAEYHPLPQ